jgi:hypothetical protein
MSNNNNIDLDINSYNFFELLNIYHLSNDNNYENLNKIEDKLKLIKTKFSSDIYSFYFKAARLIIYIYALFEQNYILSMSDTKSIQIYMEKIKKINEYEKYKPNEIINIIVENKIKQERSQQSIFETDVNSVLNTTSRLNTLDSLVHNKTNIVYSAFPNSVAPGDLNSIKRITQLINFNLNSCFRNNYYASNPCDFQYFIPTEVKNVLSMRLASIEMPNAWYLFSQLKKNNTFNICIGVCGETKIYPITVPDGNYDCDSLQNYLNTTYFYEAEKDNHLKYIKFSIHPHNFKTTFELTINHPATFSYSLQFVDDINQNIMNTMGWTLGFRLGNYLDISGTITSEGLFDAGGDRYIYMAITDYQYNNNMSNIVGFDKSMLNEDIIAKIPIVNGKLSLLIDENNNPLAKSRKYNGPVNLSKLHIKILDKFGKVIDFNNMDYSFTLELEVLYESFNFKNVTG